MLRVSGLIRLSLISFIGRLARFLIRIYTTNALNYPKVCSKNVSTKGGSDEQGLMRSMYVPRPMNHILKGTPLKGLAMVNALFVAT